MKKNFITKRLIAGGGIAFNIFVICLLFLFGWIDGQAVRESFTSNLMVISFFTANVCIFVALMDDNIKENNTNIQETGEKKKWGISEKIRFLLGLFCGIATALVLLWFVFFIVLQIF